MPRASFFMPIAVYKALARQVPAHIVWSAPAFCTLSLDFPSAQSISYFFPSFLFRVGVTLDGTVLNWPESYKGQVEWNSIWK